MKKSAKSALTAEQKKANKSTAAKAKRASKKATAAFEAEQTAQHAETVVDLGTITIPESSFAEQNSIESIEVEEMAPVVAIDSTPEAKAAKAQAAAREFLGEEAIVWSVTQDAKGKAFTTPRFRVGLPADKDTGYLIESGRKIIGAGNSYAEAVTDARKRTAAKVA